MSPRTAVQSWRIRAGEIMNTREFFLKEKIWEFSELRKILFKHLFNDPSPAGRERREASEINFRQILSVGEGQAQLF
jgi:hypothetical protein